MSQIHFKLEVAVFKLTRLHVQMVVRAVSLTRGKYSFFITFSTFTETICITSFYFNPACQIIAITGTPRND